MKYCHFFSQFLNSQGPQILPHNVLKFRFLPHRIYIEILLKTLKRLMFRENFFLIESTIKQKGLYLTVTTSRSFRILKYGLLMCLRGVFKHTSKVSTTQMIYRWENNTIRQLHSFAVHKDHQCQQYLHEFNIHRSVHR